MAGRWLRVDLGGFLPSTFLGAEPRAGLAMGTTQEMLVKVSYRDFH